jgi:hypothetical protein
MAKLSDGDLKALLAAERADSLHSSTSSVLSDERTKAMNYFLGDMDDDIPAPAGRSSAVSTDVADTIEGLMPSLMEIFAGSDDAVRFEPVGPEDIDAAEQETEYVGHVFWQQNDGFSVLYSMIKDALLSKLGIVKVWWDEYEEESTETYLDQSEEELALMLQSNPEVEIVEHTPHEDEYGNVTHDVTLKHKKSYACAKCEPVPPEEFGIAKRARKLRDTHYCFHEVQSYEAKLIGEGYDPEVVKKLQTYALPKAGTTEQQARDTVQESQVEGGDSGMNKAMRPIRVTEHYIRMDYEGNGKAKLYRVITGGEDGVVLTREGKPAVVEQDVIPFACATPFPMPHRVFGRSVADVVMDIQRIKTVLIRGLLDNTYAANMPRPVVAENFSSQETLDDLAVMRHGAPIRVEQPGAIDWQKVPSIVNHVFPVLEYFDATREWRTGVSRQGQGLDADALQNQTATAANQLFNAAQARMKMIARVFAETGIKDLFWLLHTVIRKNAKKEAVIRLNNDWEVVDPRNWKTRNDITVTVGLGQGGKAERLAQMQMVIGMQQTALEGGLLNLVTPKNLYNAAREVTKIMEQDVELFFTDPGDEPLEPQPDPKETELQMKAELDKASMEQKAEIERLQAEADIATQQRKTEAEMAMAEKKFQLDRELKILEHDMKMEESRVNRLTQAMKATQQPAGADGEAAPSSDASNAVLGEVMAELKRLNARKRIVRDENGQLIGIEPAE